MLTKFFAVVVVCVFSFPALASETVKMIWPFGPVAATNPYRLIIEQTNTSQKQYQFVLDFVTGAGGSIAVNSVASSATPAVLAHSAAFFIHPKMADRPAYDVNEWRLIKHICDVQYPLASVKYKSMQEIPQDRPITVGVLGLGSTTHLVQQYFLDKHPNFVAIPYKTSTAAIADVLGGHLDLTVTLPGDVLGHHESKTINLLGVTGLTALKNVPTFVSQGYADSDKLVGAYYIFVNRKLDPAIQNRWKELFHQINNQELDRVSNSIICQPSKLKPSELDREFEKMDRFWTRLASKTKK